MDGYDKPCVSQGSRIQAYLVREQLFILHEKKKKKKQCVHLVFYHHYTTT